MSGGAISAAAEVQRRLWGTDPRAWADLAEAHNRPLFEAVLDAAGVGPGTRVLDVGCGSGLTLVLAGQRGAAPERSQGTVVHEAMSALIPPEQADDHAPYALSAPGNLEAALADAGLRIADSGEVVCFWRYASMDDAVGGLLCSAGGARAVQAAGERAVRDVLQRSLAQFQDPQTRVVTMRNTFRWVAACR